MILNQVLTISLIIIIIININVIIITITGTVPSFFNSLTLCSCYQLLKSNVDILAPFLTYLFCWSLEYGVVPSRMKSAYITPIKKKADMDATDVKSYRPISNLCVLSKLLERLVSQQ